MIPQRSLERLAGAFALFAIAIAALLLGKPYFTNAARPARGIQDPVVALQVARSIGEVDLVLSEAPSPDRETMRFKQNIDFFFIGGYTAMFLTLAWLLLRLGGWGWAAGPAAMICAVAAASFDVWENRAILRILDVPLFRTSPAMINAIRSASAAKWTLAAFTLAITSSYFFRRKGWLSRLAAALMVVTAAMDLYGLRDNRFLVWQGIPGLASLAAIAAALLVMRG
jgi:hypothetical protein